MWRVPVFAGVAAALWIASGVAYAQVTTSLDDLVGRWTLLDTKGAVVGDSVVVAQRPGVMLYEERRIGDAAVQPLWFAHLEEGGWRQLFVGVQGTLRAFATESAPGTWPVVMGATVTAQDGRATRFRMTISHVSSTEMRRILQSSRDGGGSWTVVFDYVYRRLSP